ncbi:MAG: primosomal protein N' [Oscillospiraceae bacterium]
MCTGVEVAVDNAAFKFDRLYTYCVPQKLAGCVKIGTRVLVPFGHGAPRLGVVLRITSVEDSSCLKELIDAELGEPILEEELVKLVELLKEQTLCTYGDALKTVLPKNSRLVANSSSEQLEAVSTAHMETAFEAVPQTIPMRLTKRQTEVMGALADGAMTYTQLNGELKVSREVVNKLEKLGAIKKIARERDESFLPFKEDANIPPLTPAQEAAFEKIVSCECDRAKPDATLLRGVTSSGKTLIYIRLIERAVKSGKSAMILVPEITLATQMISRLRGLFGSRVGIIHSALGDTERMVQWKRIQRGDCDIIVGTRSAVFAPVKKLGIVIVDEEQEATYVSEQSPRYNAITMAAHRASFHGAHLLLASATPSLETYHKARTGAINLVEIDERYKNMPLPTVKIVDMRNELMEGNTHCISGYLRDEIAKRLERHEQTILLLNRRGYRTVSICNKCKKIVKCPNCDTPLVVHKQRGCYVCHYCMRTSEISAVCDECGGAVRHMGIGTQKAEEELAALFPEARIMRFDFDAVTKKDSAARLLKEFAEGRYDIIIGTQMIAKGLDFPNVTLVGVLSIDQLLLMQSYRASERAFSMLTQVIGRSGRGDVEGEAVIQTVDPDNEVIMLAAKQDYKSFFTGEIISRKTHLYPPFCSLCTVGFLSEKEKNAQESAQSFSKILKEKLAEQKNIPIRVLGPAPMRVAYINNTYRWRLVLKCRNDRAFRDIMRECIYAWNKISQNKSASLTVDFASDAEN